MQCAICHLGTNMGCSLCQKVFYCSRQHQERHWLKHKSECSGRVRKVLESEYNTLTDNLLNSRKSSPDNRYHYSKEKKQQDSMRQNQKLKEMQFVERVHQFVESSEARKDERSKILIEYAKGKEETLVNRAKKLMLFSQDIYKDFDNAMNKTLIDKFKIRTSKYIQQLQSFLDACFLTKLYLRCGMREELKKQIYSLKLPAIPEKISLTPNDPSQLDSYKLYKQQVKFCKIALSLIASIGNAGGFYSYTENIYKIYIHLIERCFGVNQQCISYFLVGNWYVEIREYSKAISCYQYCIELKKRESSQEQILGDCYFNIALCARMMGDVKEAIDKMNYSLSIRRRKNGLEVAECLEFIGKQYLDEGKLIDAHVCLEECHFIKKELLKKDDPGMLTINELSKKLFYKIKEQKQKQGGEVNSGESLVETSKMEKGIGDFGSGKANEHFYQEYGFSPGEKRIQKVRLDPEWTEWIEELGAKELTSLGDIMKKSEIMTFDDAILYVLNSDFYKSLNEEKQRKFKELNPDFNFAR